MVTGTLNVEGAPAIPAAVTPSMGVGGCSFWSPAFCENAHAEMEESLSAPPHRHTCGSPSPPNQFHFG